MGSWTIIALFLFYPETATDWISSPPGLESETWGHPNCGASFAATLDSKALNMVAGIHQWKLQVRIMVRIGVDGDGCRLVVLRLSSHDVRHEGLRVAIVEREPGALNLDHYRVSCFEDMIDVMQAVAVLLH